MAAESTKSKTLDEGGKNIVALMVALLVAIFAFQLNASMLSPALVAMQNELHTTATEIGNTQTVFSRPLRCSRCSFPAWPTS